MGIDLGCGNILAVVYFIHGFGGVEIRRYVVLLTVAASCQQSARLDWLEEMRRGTSTRPQSGPSNVRLDPRTPRNVVDSKKREFVRAPTGGLSTGHRVSACWDRSAAGDGSPSRERGFGLVWLPFDPYGCAPPRVFMAPARGPGSTATGRWSLRRSPPCWSRRRGRFLR